MGNHNSRQHSPYKPHKNVHWKAAGRPNPPGKPEILIVTDSEPNDINLRWTPPGDLGGTALVGYQVECNRLGTNAWVRTSPPIVTRPELVLSGLETLHRYQFRVAAINGVGRSDYSELSNVLSFDSDPISLESPLFLEQLNDVKTLENDKTEFSVKFRGNPLPNISWFKDGYEIFSSRRTVINTNESISTLIFHQTLFSDEGEIKCTATNRAGHAVTKARLYLESPPKLRYPRQYEDGLLYEINETIFIKSAIVGKPNPVISWLHNGVILSPSNRLEIANTPMFSVLKIHSATRNDRGEYQIHAKNAIGEDIASFLVTITAPPEPPSRVQVTRAVDKSVTLTWDPPDDDGGCQIGNYLIEYYRAGWNVWLKATTSRQTSVTLFGLIEGSEYRFRVKAESPFGISMPSTESASVRIPGRAVDLDCLAIEARVISDVLLKEDGDASATIIQTYESANKSQEPDYRNHKAKKNPVLENRGSKELMVVLNPNITKTDYSEKRRSLQMEFEDWSPPPEISISTPNLPSAIAESYLRCAVSSTELLHERAMARFYKVIALREETSKKKVVKSTTNNSSFIIKSESQKRFDTDIPNDKQMNQNTKIEQINENICNRQDIKEIVERSNERVNATHTRWLSSSFDDDYTGSTVSLEEESGGELDESKNTPLPHRKDKSKELINPNISVVETFVSKTAPKSILKEIRRFSETKQENNSSEIKRNRSSNQRKKLSKPTINSNSLINETNENCVPLTKSPLQKNSSPIAEINKTNKKNVIEDEGKSVIDYYSNIVKEFGSSRKPQSQMYLKTEELKSAAEKQESEKNVKQTLNSKSNGNANFSKAKKVLSTSSSSNNKSNKNVNGTNSVTKPNTEENEREDKVSIKIALNKAEKAVLIPIDYDEIEKKAKKNFQYKFSPNSIRKYISEFRIPRSDCVPVLPQRKVVDPAKCTIKDKGLVLGVYYNENLGAKNSILTKTAQKYDAKSGGKLWELLQLTRVPRLGESRVFFDLDPKFGYVAVAGLGSECLKLNCLEKVDERAEAIRTAAAVGTKALHQFKPTSIHVESFGNAEAAAEGASLGIWEFKEFKSPVINEISRPSSLCLYDSCDYDCWNIGKIKAEAQNLVRYLQELPANILNPTSFSKMAVDLLCELDINVEVKTQGWANSYDMGGFVSIGKSSIQPPLYVEISYYGACERDRPIVLIGKGVTFNSGSLDLKPPKELLLMKGDMAGAACVLAITRAAAILKLPVNIRGILPLCELMPNGNSPHFGDVVKSATGKTIRIRLPSLEGRLLIADSLVYARNFWPKVIVDIGTMSKELIDAFGGSACAAYTNSEELYCYLENASSYTGDRIWRMPLWEFYSDRVKDTQTGDIANMARDVFGESPNCAAFLRQFVCDSQWVHFDTYNVMYTKGRDFAYLGRGMTGRPTRTIIELFCQMLADAKL